MICIEISFRTSKNKWPNSNKADSRRSDILWLQEFIFCNGLSPTSLLPYSTYSATVWKFRLFHLRMTNNELHHRVLENWLWLWISSTLIVSWCRKWSEMAYGIVDGSLGFSILDLRQGLIKICSDYVIQVKKTSGGFKRLSEVIHK